MSKIELFQTPITPNKNRVVDSIGTYLNSLTAVYVSENLHYKEITLDTTFKLQIPQLRSHKPFANYIRLTQDNNVFYYFILSANWLSKNSVEFVCSLDTLNTFWNELSWNPKTTIIREHRDRYYSSPISTNTYLRKIDKYNEGINPIKSVLSRDDKVEESTLRNNKWYLMYMANEGITPDNTTNPVSAMLISDTSVPIYPAISGSDKSYTLSSLISTNKLLFITGSGLPENDTSYFKIGTATYTLNKAGSNNDRSRVFMIKPTSTSQCEIWTYWYTGDSYPYSYQAWSGPATVSNTSTITFHNIRSYVTSATTEFYLNLHSIGTIDKLEKTVINAGTLPATTTAAFTSFDNSRSTLSKIVELPYCPINLALSSGYYPLPTGTSFHYGYNAIEIENKTYNKIIGSLTFISSELSQYMYPATSDLYTSVNESKLYSSEFYKLALEYDTTVLPVILENIKFTAFSNSLNINWALSNSMSGKQMMYISLNTGTSYDKSSISELYTEITRLNDMPILNSGYQDYIRNGYNYDLSVKNHQNQISNVSMALSFATAGLGVAGGGVGLGFNIADAVKSKKKNIEKVGQYTYDQIVNEAKRRKLAGETEGTGSAYTVAKAAKSAVIDYANSLPRNSTLPLGISFATQTITSGLSQVSTAYNTVMNIKSTNDSFNNKYNSMISSNPSISGGVDTDLFDIYNNGNKIHITRTTLKEEEKEAIAKLFYYTGYSHPVQAVPNLTSRIWFNYIQCDAEFNDETTSVYYNFIEDIKTS